MGDSLPFFGHSAKRYYSRSRREADNPRSHDVTSMRLCGVKESIRLILFNSTLSLHLIFLVGTVACSTFDYQHLRLDLI
jgi:hypothetical protein